MLNSLSSKARLDNRNGRKEDISMLELQKHFSERQRQIFYGSSETSSSPITERVLHRNYIRVNDNLIEKRTPVSPPRKAHHLPSLPGSCSSHHSTTANKKQNSKTKAGRQMEIRKVDRKKRGKGKGHDSPSPLSETFQKGTEKEGRLSVASKKQEKRKSKERDAVCDFPGTVKWNDARKRLNDSNKDNHRMASRHAVCELTDDFRQERLSAQAVYKRIGKEEFRKMLQD